MPRAKKQIAEIAVGAEVVERTLPEILDEDEDKNSEDSVIERVVNKLQKVVTIKKVLSDKQQAHLDSLAKKKKGKKVKER